MLTQILKENNKFFNKEFQESIEKRILPYYEQFFDNIFFNDYLTFKKNIQ